MCRTCSADDLSHLKIAQMRANLELHVVVPLNAALQHGLAQPAWLCNLSLSFELYSEHDGFSTIEHGNVKWGTLQV